MKSNILKKDLRNFAFIWALIFLVIGCYPLRKVSFSDLTQIKSIESVQNLPFNYWSLGLSLLFLLIALSLPQVLSGFYRFWIKLGEFIGAIISKIILFILFYAMFTPIALVLKLFGKDFLNKEIDKKVNSYWIERKTQPGSLKYQF